MEERKNTLSSLKICRFCLSQDEDSLQSLYDRCNKPIKNFVTLPLKILSCLSVEVFPSDKMPHFICRKCKYFMNLFYGFKDICRRSDEIILSFIHNGTALEPTVWPTSYAKVFKNVNKQTPEKTTGAVKNVVKSGATVQVPTQDSESEGEESIYDVKIEEDDESSACINVIASKNVPDNKSKPKEVVTDKQDLDGGNPVADGCWACDECECTYPLQQLLDLHKMKKHRERVASCDQCDAKFVSKYNLEAHKLCHTDDMPYHCIACGKPFKRKYLLKHHQRKMHSDLLQLKCNLCSAIFFFEEELDAHRKRHTEELDKRPHACESCYKRFPKKQALLRHVMAVHIPKTELNCEYCPERFSTVTKLAKHVRMHAGERPYPCKYCNKSFMKSHHCTRHIRQRHREESAPEHTEYRCEQCDDTFSSQDDLIYHSAIHATQNLTCPLCQEKFQDVDAVTAHIKSHVNGVEFQCEFCELVFTSKDKLKSHMVTEHEDEYQNIKEEDSSMDMDDFEEDNSINLKEEDDHMVVEIKKADNFMLQNSTGNKEEDKISPSEGSEPEFADTELTVRTIATPIVTHKNDVPMIELNPLVTRPLVASVTPTKQTPPPQDIVNDKIQIPSIVKKAEEAKRKLQSGDAIPEKKTRPTPKQDNAISDSASAAVSVSSGTNGPSSAGGASNSASGASNSASGASNSASGASNSASGASNSTSVGTTDKSLRLLEKELQELKRTNVRNDTNKIASKSAETPKRRPPPYSSTPKLRSDEKKGQVSLRSSAVTAERKAPERRAIKENKEPKDAKETKPVAVPKEDKDKANNAKEEKEIKENDTPKISVKNGSSDKTPTSEDVGVRRSTRPSKIKDYAKMIRERTQMDSGDDDDSDDDDEEYVEPEKAESRNSRGRRSTVKPAANKTVTKPTPPPTYKASPANPRKRGRPRKDQPPDTSAKMMKENSEEGEETKVTSVTDTSAAEEEDNSKTVVKSQDPSEKNEVQDTKTTEKSDADSATNNNRTEGNVTDGNKTPNEEQKLKLLVSPTGQTLKKVPIKALPPGVKPLPLPTATRAIGARETCEMQIGKKLVKVQKIVMTKAEVEAMAKKGLLEMKDGTMVLKQGIKLHTTDSSATKPTATEGPASKESPSMKDKPTRCEMEEKATSL